MAFAKRKNGTDDSASQSSYESTVPAVKDESDYAVMKMEKGEIVSMLRDNVGAEKLTANDLSRVTVPSQGVTTWTIPTVEGEKQQKPSMTQAAAHPLTVLPATD